MRRLLCIPLFVVGCAVDDPGEGESGEGEGEGEEGEGEGEGEGDLGEGEGEGEVPLPERACAIVAVDGDPAGVPHPGTVIRARATLPVRRAPGGVDVVTLDDGVAFVARRVGDVVFGDGDDACFVHVAAFAGLTVQLTWAEPNRDFDLELAADDEAGRFCLSGIADTALAGVDAEVCQSNRSCTFATCNRDGIYTVDFAGDGVFGDDDPVSLGDAADGPASEFIVVPAPRGRLLAAGHSYDNGLGEAVVRAWLDDVPLGETREFLEADNSGALLLMEFDENGGPGVCVTHLRDDERVVGCDGAGCSDGSCTDIDCPAFCADACFEDGGCNDCAASCANGCNHETGRCHDGCSDPGDVIDGAVLSAGNRDNVVCPGDVDVFVIDTLPFDIITVSTSPDLQITLEDDEGVIDEGASVTGVARASRVFVTIENPVGLEPGSVVRVEVESLADRCAVDDAREPDPPGAGREAVSRSDGVLCPDASGGDDIDCVAFAPVDDRLFFLDRLQNEAVCIVDGVDCARDGRRFWLAVGDELELCVRSSLPAGDPGTAWHIRSERGVVCTDDGNDVAAEAVALEDGTTDGVICGRDVDFFVVHIGAGEVKALAVDGAVSVVVFEVDGVFSDGPLVEFAAGIERDVVVGVHALPLSGSDGSGGFTLTLGAGG